MPVKDTILAAIVQATAQMNTAFDVSGTPTTDQLVQQKLLLESTNQALQKLDANKDNDAYKQEADPVDYQKKLEAFRSLVATDQKKFDATPLSADQKATLNGKTIGTEAEQGGSDWGSKIKNFFSGAWTSITGMFSGGKKDADGNEVDEDGKPKKPSAGLFSGFDAGGVIGSVAGGFGGWFLGNIFGDGLIGKIAGALFALAGAIIGKEKLGNWIDGMIGITPSTRKPSASAAVVPQPQPQTSVNPVDVQPRPLSEQEEVQHMHDCFMAAKMGITVQQYSASNVTELPNSSNVAYANRPQALQTTLTPGK